MKTCKLLREQVAAATGSKKAELVLKNAQIVNVFTQSVETGDIAIEGGYIVGIGNYEGITEKDLGGAYVCPGFLDGHIHIESSMTSPGEFTLSAKWTMPSARSASSSSVFCVCAATM